MTDYLAAIKSMHRLSNHFAVSVKKGLRDAGILELGPTEALLLSNAAAEKAAAEKNGCEDNGFAINPDRYYNVVKLLAGGYVVGEKDPTDPRAHRLKVTELGEKVAGIVECVAERHVRALDASGIDRANVSTLAGLAHRIESLSAGPIAW